MAHDITPAVAVVAFWWFVATVVVAGVASSVLRHRETQKTIRQAIEKGQSLNPETLERLLQMSGPLKGAPPRKLLLAGGVMLLALAVGMVLIGVFGAVTNPAALSQGLGVGGLLGMLGAGLLVTAVLVGGTSGNGRG